MQDRSSINPYGLVNRAGDDKQPEADNLEAPLTRDGKNAAAVMLGRRGGLKGGVARAERLSSDRRREIASKAATARWEKKNSDASN